MNVNGLLQSMASMFNGGSVSTPVEEAPIAVIIVGRNYGRFLGDCIESVQQQSVRPAELVYLDNASTDESTSVARERGICCRSFKRERHISAVRNDGARWTKAPFLLWIDADDLMPPGYLSALWSAMKDDGRVGISYPRILMFGPKNGAIRPGASWGHAMLMRQNFMPSASLVRRAAFDETAGWPDTPLLHDWRLWLDITARQWLIAQGDTDLHVRTHVGSLTSGWRNGMAEYQDVLHAQPVTVVVTFGPGRRAIRRKASYRTLERCGIPWERAQLVFYDNTRNEAEHRELKDYLRKSQARETVYLTDDGAVSFSTSAERARVLPRRMTSMWRRLARVITHELVLSVEDDIEAPEGAYRRLFEGMTPDTDGVTGVYWGRPPLDGGSLVLRHWGKDEQGREGVYPLGGKDLPGGLSHLPADGLLDVGTSGIGFALIRREALDGYEPDIGHGGNWTGHDFSLWRHVVKERKRRLLAHCGLRCNHWHSAKEHV